MANLITGYRGTEHVTAADAGSFNAAAIGSGKYVFNSGQSFKAEVVSNNLVRVYDGDILNQGRHIRIDTGDYEDAEIATGLVDTYRNDLIVMRYTKDTESQVESANITVIQGVSGDTAVDPTYISDDILNGAEVDDVPLYRVKLESLSIVKVEALFEVTDSVMALVDSLKSDLTNHSKQINELNTNISTINSKTSVLDSMRVRWDIAPSTSQTFYLGLFIGKKLLVATLYGLYSVVVWGSNIKITTIVPDNNVTLVNSSEHYLYITNNNTYTIYVSIH